MRKINKSGASVMRCVEDKIVIVTDPRRGIGVVTACMLAREGG